MNFSRTTREAGYVAPMPAIHVKSVPAELHDELRQIADHENCSVNEIILQAIKREIDRRKHSQWLDGVFARPSGVNSTVDNRRSFIAELRTERDAR